MLSCFVMVVGFILLIKGADYFVEGASSLASYFHIPQIVVGLTIVAFGTSAPEMAISIVSAIKKSSDLAIGNIIGSNIINVLLVLGIVGSLSKVTVKKTTYQYEIPFVLIITLLLLILGKIGNVLNVYDGLILLFFFGLFFLYLIYVSKQEVYDQGNIECISLKKIFIYIISGIIGIVIGSQLTINSVNEICYIFGFSKRFIGLTIVAFGTSLPELVTSITAILKGKDDLSVGNIIGSNIFNILFVLGLSSLFCGPLVFIDQFVIDGLVAIFSLMIFYVFINKRYEFVKIGAVIMLFFYFLYFIYIM
ncbi:MAG: calcium/sodium antiporter [Faecalibacillus sp.]